MMYSRQIHWSVPGPEERGTLRGSATANILPEEWHFVSEVPRLHDRTKRGKLTPKRKVAIDLEARPGFLPVRGQSGLFVAKESPPADDSADRSTPRKSRTGHLAWRDMF